MTRGVINHIGLTVPDIRAAVAWYTDVFGMRCIMGPRVLRSASLETAETASILGADFRFGYQAHLLDAQGVGIELFQFVEPPTLGREEELGWSRRGPWHVCFTVTDIDEQMERVLRAGGEQVSQVTSFVPGRPWKLVYLRDPWGTVLELMNAPYAEVFSGWPQAGSIGETEWMPPGRLDGEEQIDGV